MADNTQDIIINPWNKECPLCNSYISYSCKKSLTKSLRQGWVCKRCSACRSHSENPRTFFSDENYRTKISNSLSRIRNGESYGDSFKEKCRINRAKQLKLGINGTVNFNEKACDFINRLNSSFGWSLQHALNGGEKEIGGYFLDGFDEKLNIAFEYDEPKHHTLSQKERDKKKFIVILNIQHPNEFWRYDEKNELLYEVIGGKKLSL